MSLPHLSALGSTLTSGDLHQQGSPLPSPSHAQQQPGDHSSGTTQPTQGPLIQPAAAKQQIALPKLPRIVLDATGH
jgi:hypothetical protein